MSKDPKDTVSAPSLQARADEVDDCKRQLPPPERSVSTVPPNENSISSVSPKPDNSDTKRASPRARQDHRAFVGVAELKKLHSEQLAKFRKWANSRCWKCFHQQHYDWWAFPIDEQSRFKYKYSVKPHNITELQKDAEFIAALREGVRLLMCSWGFDIDRACMIADKDRKKDQMWAEWPIRLYKAGRCMQLFGQKDYFLSMYKFAKDLRARRVSLIGFGRDTIPDWEQYDRDRSLGWIETAAETS